MEEQLEKKRIKPTV